ncbi:MAG: hypothetical protein NTX50_13850 [Candidatus Sumerlaeota bacterium]|nr:hypothetical protein [Candidatus Sumerlaeota bacterium]
MININLLPEKRPMKAKAKAADATTVSRATGAAGKGGAMGGLVAALTVVVCLGALGYYGYSILSERQAAMQAYESAKAEKENLQKEAKALEKSVAGLSELSSILDNELAALKALSPDDRVIWAEKLYQLAKLTPVDVYYTVINVTETVTEEITEDSKKEIQKWIEGGSKGPKPPEAKKTIFAQNLDLNGVVYAKDVAERPKMINDLYGILKTFSLARIAVPEKKIPSTPGPEKKIPFMLGFANKVLYGTFMREKLYDVEVTRFSFSIPAIARIG